ncbi:MAG: N-acetyl-alpha-D-glucosaminyl L-malate synthase BshA, partial [Gemmatimonadales bacterium]|nr:N-acetyl-alpha-D-glucosaminyl L-malate synthase BshA [Gemmatimonadales bacterium]
CYPTYGGSGAVATELGLDLARRGHEIHLISYASPFRLRGFTEHVYFHEVDLSGTYPLLEYFPYSLALAVKQEEVALREELDILHVHYAVPHATAAFLAKEMIRGERDLKVVTTLHGTDITLVGQESSFFTVTKFSIERSDAVTAVSEFLKDETYEAFGCVGCGIEVIPNFVNPAEYFPSDDVACRSSLAPPDTKVLMHVSNFREVKRVPDVVRVFAKVRESLPAVLVLVGDGPERPGTEAEVEKLGLTKHVHFLGKVDAVADLLRAADLFLLPSASESFGLSALEAMACGVPVVASRVGGLPEVVDDGGGGALVPAGDLDAMTENALALLEPERWRAARAAAVRRAQLFSAERIVPRYEALYSAVLGR